MKMHLISKPVNTNVVIIFDLINQLIVNCLEFGALGWLRLSKPIGYLFRKLICEFANLLKRRKASTGSA